MLNVRHLAVFRAVMKSGSVSAAARMLHISQPAITKTLQLMEGRIGLPLFRRVKGRLHPTSESLLLLPKIEQIFGAVDQAEHLASEIAGGGVGRITLATVATLSGSVTAAAIAKYRQKRPNVTIQVQALSTRQVIDLVTNNQVDIGIIDADIGDDYLSFEELCAANIGCVMPRDHRLAKHDGIEAEDLRGEVLITFDEHTIVGWLLRERLRKLDHPINIAITTNQSLVACLLANQRTGLGLIDPFLMLSNIFPDLTMIPLKPPVTLRPRIVFPPTRPLSIAGQEFVETVKKTVAELIPKSPLLQKP